MKLNFPHQPDVRLLRSPLTDVICQVRIPPILRIAKGDPTEFQEMVRKQFPLFEVEQNVNFRIDPPGVDAQLPPRLYHFLTADSAMTLSLAVDYFALSTNQYTVWEEFADKLAFARRAVEATYQPAFSTRIGLRYVDNIRPSKLGFATLADVVNLLRPELTTTFRTDAWTDPREMMCHLVLEDNGGRLSFRFGKRIDESEPVFTLDFDYFEEGQFSLDDLVARCNRYHQVIYDAFRWCIKEDRLSVFEPVEKEVVQR